MSFDVVPVIATLGGAGGIVAGIRAINTTIRLFRQGVSAREGKRRIDLVQQRDEAIRAAQLERDRADAANERAVDEQARADWADANRQVAVGNEQRAREHAADLRIELQERAGVRREELPAWPAMERTIPRAEFDRLRRERERQQREDR